MSGKTKGISAAWLVLTFGTAHAARANSDELLKLVPPYANAVVAVDASFAAGAPAGANAAAPGAAAARPRSPLPLPRVAGLKSLVLAARVHTATLEPVWEVALMEVGQKFSMPAVALASGGYPDAAPGGRPGAVCATGVYCVQISNQVIGAVYPTDRQFVARWLGDARTAPAAAPAGAAGAKGAAVGAPSEYLRAAANSAGSQTPVVIALDLSDSVGEGAAQRMLEMDRPRWAGPASTNDKALAAVLASVKGVTVRIGSIGPDGADATMTVDFGRATAPLEASAKTVVTGAMADWGVSVPDLAQWEYVATGNTITGRGPLSAEGIERLVSFLSLPGVAAPAEGQGDARTAAATGAPRGAADEKQARAEASRKYYKTVSTILDSFKPGNSLSDGAAWLTRSATRIDQLPADNVDPDLLLWGADVSARLRETSGIMSAGQLRVRARSSGVGVSTAYARYGSEADTQLAAQARADRENARRQANQAAAEERAAVQQEAGKPIEAAMESRGRIRATMVARYGGGF